MLTVFSQSADAGCDINTVRHKPCAGDPGLEPGGFLLAATREGCSAPETPALSRGVSCWLLHTREGCPAPETPALSRGVSCWLLHTGRLSGSRDPGLEPGSFLLAAK